MWPEVSETSLTDRPFHVYDPEFYDIIGSDPSLTLLATSETDPIFHEAVVWLVTPSFHDEDLLMGKRYPPTDEVFFVQNAGDPAAGTGLNKSSVVQKISLAEAEALRNGSHAEPEVKVHVLSEEPKVINPNGNNLHSAEERR